MSTLLFAYLPLAVLIYLMVKKNSMASSRALPLSACLIYLVVIFVFQFDATLVHASVISGLLLALTPLSIVAGAIYLFKCMEDTGALDTLKSGLNAVSQHPIAQLMIVGWAFTFMLEGASGFGTPAAIAAPILYALGFPAIRVAVFCLILNTIPVTFGALGTPIWFGLFQLSLPPSDLANIAQQAAIINTLAAPVIVFIALRLVIEDKSLIKHSTGFILLSTFACTLPHWLMSYVDVEFPSLIGGIIGLVITIAAAKYRIGLPNGFLNGLSTIKNDKSNMLSIPSLKMLLVACFPIYATVLVLLLTRLPAVGLKSWLQASTPAVDITLGHFGTFYISPSLVVRLENILGTSVSWSHSVLYIPSILPFVLVGILTLLFCKSTKQNIEHKHILIHTANKLKAPFFALLGALVFVNLMMLGDEASAVSRIGFHLATVTGEYWTFFAPLLGALGSFFSGSATISNLTFSGVQLAIAEQLSLSSTTILALQSVGAAMGNMICINNIVAVTAILGLNNAEGTILKQNIGALMVYGGIAGISGFLLML